MLNIKFKNLAIVAYGYIVLPIIIFFITWLKWYIGIPMAIVLLIGLNSLMKLNYSKNDREVNISIKAMLIACIILFIWILVCGQGGFFFQTWDHHTKNAIFRDMIDFSWPVIYPETGNGLVYYLMHWIIPAIVGKILGWKAANIALALWSYFGVVLIYLLLLYITKSTSNKKMFIVLIILVTWSGLNNIGLQIMDIFNQGNFILGFSEGWLDAVTGKYWYAYQYSGNDTLISWVFNQTIVPWMAILLILENKKIRTFAFIGLCILPYAPFPFVGLIPILFSIALPWYIENLKCRNFKKIFKETFSISNLSAIITIFPIFLCFYKSNVIGQQGGVSLYVPIDGYDIKRIAILILFYILEFGIYMILIVDKYKKNNIYKTIAALLIVIPLFKVGESRDFLMRASIPALFILMVFVIDYLNNIDNKNAEKRKSILVIILTIAALNPLGDLFGKLNYMYDTKKFPIIADETKTLSNMNIGDENPNTFEENYIVPNPEKTIFFKHLAKMKVN